MAQKQIIFIVVFLFSLLLISITIKSDDGISESNQESIERTKTTNTYCLNGVCNSILSLGEINYWNGTKYVPIETTLKSSKVGNYIYELTSAPYKAYFKENLNTGESIRFEKDGYFFIYDISGGDMLWAVQDGKPAAKDTLGGGCPSNSQDSIAVVEGNRVEYPTAFCNTNVTYQIYEDMLKETFILTGLPSIKAYTYLQYSGNIKAKPL